MKAKFLSVLAGFVTAGSLILSGTSYAAGSAAFSLSPASGTKDVNSTFSVGIYENGSAVNVVTANFSYDTSKLQLVSIDTSASAFAGDAGTSGTSISRYVPGGGTVSGSAEVAVLNFKAIAGSGAAAVTVGTAGSHIASAGTEQWNGASASGNYTLNTPSSTPTTPTPPTNNSGSNTGTGTTTTSIGNRQTTGSAATSPQGNSTATNTSTATVEGATTGDDKSTTANKGQDNKTKTVGIVDAKATNASHTIRNTVAWTSLLVLIAGAAAIYWAYFRKVPAPVVVSVTKKKPAAKKATASKAKTTKSPSTTKKKA